MYYLLICKDGIQADITPYTIVEEVDNKFISSKDSFCIAYYSKLSEIRKPNSDLSITNFDEYVARCNLITVPFNSFEDAKNAYQTHPEYFI